MGRHRRGKRPEPRVSALTLLHTAASHAPRFAALLSELAPEVRAKHVVLDSLLASARERGGVDSALSAELTGVLKTLAEDAEVILCTCSTLGAAAEALGSALGARVVRVDRPLARAAVARGRDIVVLAALQSTLAPTRELLEEEALKAGKTVRLELLEVEKAWAHFESGAQQAYLQTIADAADGASARAEVLVLAQASMFGAERLVRTSKPVLSSPRLGLQAALTLLPAR